MFAVPYTELVAGQLRTTSLCSAGSGARHSVDCLCQCCRTFSGTGRVAQPRDGHSNSFWRPCVEAGPPVIGGDAFVSRHSDVGWSAGWTSFGRLLLWLVPRDLAAGFDVRTEPTVLAFAAVAGLLTAVISGLAPALRIVHGQKNASPARRRSQHNRFSRASTFALYAGHHRSRSVLLLLTGTGLFLSSLQQLQQVNPGFESKGILSGTVNLGGAQYQDNKDRQSNFITAVTQQLSHSPACRLRQLSMRCHLAEISLRDLFN